ncbi:CDP-alcohol phosphatidyltransferase family protein [Paractinoplanes abujensis]|uniref:CDP-diacylglycerol--glycerol-3-phosphate 3-phosphatidyltransferase n=1 Tax=Paractinoplanes abujensis TaxID=882441 RepID=A0A7W7CTF1_9ACTN|nr:CDP-diacylglycerol--glycerol-3-phosphate 3-phosphatidyltransferase [Actinoplanes abujensis]
MAVAGPHAHGRLTVLWDDYATAWSGLHGGFDPRRASFLVRGWVRIAYGIGSWLGRHRIGPMTVTTAGLLICATVPVAVLADRWGALLAAVLVLVAALADGLDGAVAVITGRTTRLGYVYDSVADRLGELAWLTAFWLAGAPGWLVATAGAASWLQEYARARATAAGMAEIGVVTVAERPTRVLVAIFGLLAAALVPVAITVATGVWLALALVAGIQLTIAVRRALS